jgi:hypothetical protein
VVEDLIEEMFRSAETGRVITNEPWSSMQSQRKLTRPLPEVEGEVCQKKDLTGPTLLEMSGKPTYQELSFESPRNDWAGHKLTTGLEESRQFFRWPIS